METAKSGVLEKLRSAGMKAGAHGYATRAFHWIGGIVLVYAFIENGERTKVLFNSAAMHRDVILGILVSAIFIARAAWVYFFRGGSRLPFHAPRWERVMTWLSHVSIYGSLALVLVTGFLIAHLRPGALIIRRRRFLRSDNPFLVHLIRFHAGVADFLLFLIYLHIANALWHWILREDGLWESMTGRSLNSIRDSLKARLARILSPETSLRSDDVHN